MRAVLAIALAIASLWLVEPSAAQSFRTTDWENQDPASMADASAMAGSLMPVSFRGSGSGAIVANMLGAARLATFSGGTETLPSLNTLFALFVMVFVIGILAILNRIGTAEDVIQPLPIRLESQRISDIPS